jgi:hypothetical protein
MSELFPHNCYDPKIVNQPEIEYRVAKYPFRVRNAYKESGSGELVYWNSTHCPVCFWNMDIDFWDSMIGNGTRFCRRCGQKIKWDEEEFEEWRAET